MCQPKVMPSNWKLTTVPIGRAAARLVVAEVERHAAGGRTAADGQVDRGAADVLPVEVGALDSHDVGVRDRGGGAVDVDRVGLAVEDLDAGRVAPGLVHRQAALEVDVVGDLRRPSAGAGGWCRAASSSSRSRRCRCRGRARRAAPATCSGGNEPTVCFSQSKVTTLFEVVEVVRVVLPDQVADVLGGGGRHAGGVEVEQGVHQHALELHAVEVGIEGHVEGVGLEAEVARKLIRSSAVLRSFFMTRFSRSLTSGLELVDLLLCV